MSEHLVENVIAVVEREVGHVGLYARIALERVVYAAIDDAVDRTYDVHGLDDAEEGEP